MKTKVFLLMSLILMAAFSSIQVNARTQDVPVPDSLGLPGDNLNLFAVLDLFQQCKTLEEFEKKLNLEDSKINNLDLNNDDQTDYIRVIDHQDGENHAIVLQVPVAKTENQDVAVIYIDKDKSGTYHVQIIGNEDLYGKDYIIEPNENFAEGKEAGASETAHSETRIVEKAGTQTTIYVSVSYWPVIRYIYTPTYTLYVSPWNWYSYPPWWRPWSPWYWRNYYGYYYHHHPYWHGYYYHSPHYRNPEFNHWYGSRSSSSPTVKHNRTSGVYSKTYELRNNSAGPGKRSMTPNPGYNQGKRDDINPGLRRVEKNQGVNNQSKTMYPQKTSPANQGTNTKQRVNPSPNTKSKTSTVKTEKPAVSNTKETRPPMKKEVQNSKSKPVVPVEKQKNIPAEKQKNSLEKKTGTSGKKVKL